MEIPAPPEGWNARLAAQLDFHWTHHVRPRLEGLTDDEYFWEPVPGCWSLRPRGSETAQFAGGSGEFVMEAAYPDPDPAPVTTIAWRMAHLVVPCLGVRVASHFGGPPIDFFGHDYAATAEKGLSDLDAAIEGWTVGVRSLGTDRLDEAVGQAEGPFAAHTFADLILHVHREVIHHSAEILLLRQLYLGRS